MNRAWAIGATIVGLAILALESVVIAPASAGRTSNVLGGDLLGLQSVLTQLLLVVVIVPLLAVGLVRGSWIAFLATFTIGLVPLAWWIELFATNDAMTHEPPAILVVLPALLIMAGLTLAWPPLRHASTGDAGPVRKGDHPRPNAERR